MRKNEFFPPLLRPEEGHPIALKSTSCFHANYNTGLRILFMQRYQNLAQALMIAWCIVVAAGTRDEGTRLVEYGDIAAALADVTSNGNIRPPDPQELRSRPVRSAF